MEMVENKFLKMLPISGTHVQNVAISLSNQQTLVAQH